MIKLRQRVSSEAIDLKESMLHFRNPRWSVLLVLVMIVTQLMGPVQAMGQVQLDGQDGTKSQQATRDLQNLVDELDMNLDLSKPPLTTEEQQVAELITQRVSSTEWLGALAPIALSPFFGLTCLSGIAIVGEDYLPADHYLRRASTPLRNPLVFIVFLLLTVLTSLPKLSKVSKPFAQAVDQMEAYAALIILLVIRFIGNIETGPTGTEEIALVQAGFVDFSAESLLMLATVVNVIVINTVKFFFEILIWITPVPFIDAIFEVANKTMCAALTAVYAFNPMIATVINLLLLAACLLAFRWVKRREVYYRTILFDFVRGWFSKSETLPADGKLLVFPTQAFDDIPPFAKCELSSTNDGWLLSQPRLLRSPVQKSLSGVQLSIDSGILKNSLQIDQAQFYFGRRYNRDLAGLAKLLKASLSTVADERSTGNMAMELA